MEPDIAIINIKNLKERMNRAYRQEFYGYIGDIDIINKTIDTLLEERQQNKEKIKELEEKNKKNLIEIICYQEEFENSIPVSLVEKKIEERKLWLSSNDIGYKDDYVLEVLQELLERRK